MEGDCAVFPFVGYSSGSQLFVVRAANSHSLLPRTQSADARCIHVLACVRACVRAADCR